VCDSEARPRNRCLGISWVSDSEALLQAVHLKLGAREDFYLLML